VAFTFKFTSKATVLALLLAPSLASADKSPTTATALSGIGAGVSGAVIVSSFLVGTSTAEINTPLFLIGLGSSIVTPSLGQIYSGEYFTWGMAARGAATALAAIALLGEEKTVACDDGINKNCKTLQGAGLALVGLAAIAYIGGMAYDVNDASDAAARANVHALFTLVPTMDPHSAGLALAGRF
jgi:hypothetical protein